MSEGAGRTLSRREFDAVIRRAAQLAASDPDTAEGVLTEAELFRIADEVGLSEAHVRHALTDVRAGAEGGGVLDRIFGPLSVRASRVVPEQSAAVSARIDDFLVASQLLQSVRRGVGVLQYRPAVDWASQVARAASFSSRKYYVASARSVEVRLESVDEDRTLVEFLVDPGTRRDDLAGAVLLGGGGGVGVGLLVVWGLTAVTSVGVAITVGAIVGAGAWAAIGYAVGRSHKGKLREVQIELEGVLDTLETGASLEPPPASWRRWVKRHFHGVAKDLMKE